MAEKAAAKAAWRHLGLQRQWQKGNIMARRRHLNIKASGEEEEI